MSCSRRMASLGSVPDCVERAPKKSSANSLSVPPAKSRVGIGRVPHVGARVFSSRSPQTILPSFSYAANGSVS